MNQAPSVGQVWRHPLTGSRLKITRVFPTVRGERLRVKTKYLSGSRMSAEMDFRRLFQRWNLEP